MFKKGVVLTLILFSTICFSQEIVNSFPLDFKNNRDVFQIVNEATKKITFFASDTREVRAFLLNEKMKVTDSLKIARPENKYADIAGYNEYRSSPRLFWISENYKEIYSQYYNFENHSVSNQEYTLKLKDEKFVQYFSENNLFYMVTIIKESNILKFYIFDVDGKMSEKTIDFTGFRFLDENNHKLTFYGILREFNAPLNAVISIQAKATISLQKISPKDMTSLTYSSSKRKCYLKNNLLTFSIDLSPNFTQLIFIDLNTFTATEKFITKPFVANEDGLKLNSNSFLMDNKLYQIKLSSTVMKLTIKSLDDILLKEYTVAETESIDFKNSEIIQKGTLFSSENRILEKASQFLRKVNNNSCGVSCYSLRGNVLITLGGVSDIKTGGGKMPMGGFGGFGPTSFNGYGGVHYIPATPSTSFGYLYVNPTYDNFNSYKNRRVIYINCLFDKDINHISGELKPIAFDKIQDFLIEDDNHISATLFSNPENKEKSKTVFKMDSNYYLGHYDNEKKRYIIRKFED